MEHGYVRGVINATTFQLQVRSPSTGRALCSLLLLKNLQWAELNHTKSDILQRDCANKRCVARPVAFKYL